MTGSKHSNSLGNSCEVLVVMDLQPRLLSSISGSSSLLNANSILLRASEFLEIPTIITEQVPDKLGKTVPLITESIASPQVIAKDSFSAFGSPEFCEKIQSLNAGRITLSGIETSICVFLTALDAISSNINVSVVSDCVGSRIMGDGDRCLKQLLYHGVEVIPLETYLFRNLKSSTHKSFKQITGLIKSRQ